MSEVYLFILWAHAFTIQGSYAEHEFSCNKSIVCKETK